MKCARVLAVMLALALAGCGSAGSGAGTQRNRSTTAGILTSVGVPGAHPQVVEPSAGAQAQVIVPEDPVGNVHDHPPPLSEVRRELRLEYVAVKANAAGYIDPLQYVTHWERTDQGVDANMPVGAPILAPGKVKILAVERNWYVGQPLVYFELLDGAQAGQAQYVAEEITDIAYPGTILQQGQVIARYAKVGTGIEYGWSTLNGITVAVATGGYEEGQITPAGRYMRAWLNALGAHAGPDY